MQIIAKIISAGCLIGANILVSTIAVAQSPCPGQRALNGKCVNQDVIEATQNRAMVMTTVRNSYFGTPIGTVGGSYIPFERLFRDNPAVFGLPTYPFFFVGESGPGGVGAHFTK